MNRAVEPGAFQARETLSEVRALVKQALGVSFLLAGSQELQGQDFARYAAEACHELLQRAEGMLADQIIEQALIDAGGGQAGPAREAA